MKPTMLEVPPTDWWCPSCVARDRTRVAGPHTRMHICAGLKGLEVPMLPVGTKGHHQIRVREDYEGKTQLAQKDENGRAIMSVQTIRDNGEDCTVLAPTALIGV